jgi:hypothetical protein
MCGQNLLTASFILTDGVVGLLGLHSYLTYRGRPDPNKELSRGPTRGAC